MNVASKEHDVFIPKFVTVDKIFTSLMGCILSLLFLIDIILNLKTFSALNVESLIGSLLIFIPGYYYDKFKSFFNRLILLASGATMILLAQFYTNIFDFNIPTFFLKFIIVILPLFISTVIYFYNIPNLLRYKKNKD